MVASLPLARFGIATLARSNETKIRRVQTLLILTALAGLIFLLPSRFTTPSRVLFTEATGRLQTATFQATGEALAAGGTLTEVFMSRDRERALSEELARLRHENLRLKLELADSEEAVRAAENFATIEVAAHALRIPVSAYDTLATQRAIATRAGRKHGVDVGMAVTAAGALVGTIVEAGTAHSRVRLISDAESVIPCWLVRIGPENRPLGRTLWLLRGSSDPGVLRLEMMEKEAIVSEGDIVVTADLSLDPDSKLRLPDYVPVGEVTGWNRDPMRSLFLDVSVAPFANLERLEFVDILVPEE